jgi:hypothetical protein
MMNFGFCDVIADRTNISLEEHAFVVHLSGGRVRALQFSLQQL